MRDCQLPALYILTKQPLCSVTVPHTHLLLKHPARLPVSYRNVLRGEQGATSYGVYRRAPMRSAPPAQVNRSTSGFEQCPLNLKSAMPADDCHDRAFATGA